MRDTLRTAPVPTSPKHTIPHRHAPFFSVSNLRKISGIPTVQKLHVPEEQLLDLMVGIQLDLEKERQDERDRVIVYDPTFFSGLVELKDVDPLRHSMALRSSWPFVGRRAHYSFEVMTVLAEEFEDEEAIHLRRCEVTSRVADSAEEQENRFTELISPRQFHTVDSMIDKHLDEYLDDSSKCILDLKPLKDSAKSHDSVSSRYDRESTTLARLDHEELSYIQLLEQLPMHEIIEQGCISSEKPEDVRPDVAPSSSGRRSVTGLSINTKSSRTGASISSESTESYHEIEAIVHLRSPWADETDTSFAPHHFPDCSVPSTFEFLGKAPSWDHLPRHPRSKSMQSQESNVSRYRTTRIPSASL